MNLIHRAKLGYHFQRAHSPSQSSSLFMSRGRLFCALSWSSTTELSPFPLCDLVHLGGSFEQQESLSGSSQPWLSQHTDLATSHLCFCGHFISFLSFGYLSHAFLQMRGKSSSRNWSPAVHTLKYFIGYCWMSLSKNVNSVLAIRFTAVTWISKHCPGLCWKLQFFFLLLQIPIQAEPCYPMTLWCHINYDGIQQVTKNLWWQLQAYNISSKLQHSSCTVIFTLYTQKSE